MHASSTVILAVALTGAAAFACAHAQDGLDQDCGASTPEMVDCLTAKTAAWDKRLNAAYARALKETDTKQRESLRAAQRLWVQYRDANCLYYSLGEGSIARVEAAECTLRMTKSRAIEFEGKN